MVGQAQTLAGGVQLDLPLKSDAGYRTIRWRRRPWRRSPSISPPTPAHDGLVVTTSAGTPVRRSGFNNAWTNAKQRANLDDQSLRSTTCATATPVC